ncbi:hypothetical protein CDV50_16040 [Haematobacter massiliensis]|uniref:phage head-tail joining protein n=1 Tax=Haematobacter massiliensis TaxID=195105 RepID=UPI000B4A3958|nr:hypothetical protein [Haematobacter massiliensis]OWJ69829.1 hypothetical protein CDV50_16040 [Haematobacter massiliensis]
MAFTQADADRVRAAIAKGVSSVEVNGEKVAFRSLAEMRETLRMIEDELAGAASGRFGVAYARTTRGL